MPREGSPPPPQPRTEIENSARTETPHVNKTETQNGMGLSVPKIHVNGPLLKLGITFFPTLAGLRQIWTLGPMRYKPEGLEANL